MLNVEFSGTEQSSLDLREVVAALNELGGATHFSTLLKRLQGRLRHAVQRSCTPKKLLDTLVAHRSPTVEAIDASRCFYQPFGSDSYRWSLCSEPEVDTACQDHANVISLAQSRSN